MIRVAVVDDLLINRKTVQRNLGYCNNLLLVMEAVNGTDFLEKMQETTEALRPQVVLMDIDMPVMNGIAAIAIGALKYPEVRFLVLTVFDDDEKIFEAIQAGAGGYLLKDDSAVQLSEAIEDAITYQAVPMSPAIARKALNWIRTLPGRGDTGPQSTDLLSDRELEIIRLMVDGHDYKNIAAKLFISPNTVRVHISRIYEKLHINSKAQAVQLAYKFNWV